MLYSVKKKLLYAVATSVFVTIGMLAYNQDDHQRRIVEATHHNFWNLQQSESHNTRMRSVVASIPGIINGKTGLETHRDRMDKRNHLVMSECSKLPAQTPRTTYVMYNPKYKLYYCPVEKVASTFWRRFMYQLNHTNPVRSPFDVPILRALRGARSLSLPRDQREGVGLERVLKESTKFLFVRDAYSRIFSAYVDKLLAPNPFFWKSWGLPAIVRYRKNHHEVHRNSHCGYDVTFEEFVKYVIDSAHKNNVHAIPINNMCTPCAVKYTMIGKMDSFKDDIDQLFDYIHLNTTYLRVDEMRNETTLDALSDSATDALSAQWLVLSLKCISKEAILKRIWRKNQIRGFISWQENLNLSPGEIKGMNSKQFTQILTEASKRSANTGKLGLQKRQAFIEAFSTLDDNLIERIKQIYREDFKLFGYNENPAWLAGLQKGDILIDTQSFNYSQSWNLTKISSSS